MMLLKFQKFILFFLFSILTFAQKDILGITNPPKGWSLDNQQYLSQATIFNPGLENSILARRNIKEHNKNSINRISNRYPQAYRSLNRETFFATLVDSSKNGYGYYYPTTNPILYNANYGFSMIYRKWQGIEESSGYVGVAQSLSGVDWATSYPINENLSDGTPMSTGRYPSIVMGSDGTNFAVWNEYTADCSGGGGSCGRIFFSFNQNTWYQDYPNDDMIDLNNGCATNPCFPEDLWQVQPQLIETDDVWNLYTVSNSWSDGSMYFIKTTIQKSTGDYTNTDPLALDMLDNNYNIFKMNPSGEGAITNLTANVVEYLITNDFGTSWESKTIPEDLLDLEFATAGYDQEQREFFWNHESHLDSDGGLHIFVGVLFSYDGTTTASYFHFYNAIPSNQENWVINHITDMTESYNYNFILPNGNNAQESREYLFPSVSFSSSGNGVIWFLYNKISGYDATGFADVDIYLSKSENFGSSWTDLGNLTNTPDGYQLESYIHAIPSSTDNFVGFMYGIPDLDISTVEPLASYADYKQLVYFGFYGDQIVEENDLVITEIMQNPSMVGDDSGEWFEIFNRGNTPISLAGWTIKDDGDDSHVIENNLVISPDGYMVLGNNPDQVTNGGVILDYHYSDIFLGNGSDELLLVKEDGTIITIVAWDNGTTFPDPNGASMALTDISLDNSLGENWQESTTPYGDGDFGTPGVPNFSSDIDVDLTIIDFDTVLVGEPLERTLTITNTGNADLLLDSIYTSTALFTLPVTETSVETSFDLAITFSPLEYGILEDTLILISNDPDENYLEIPLIGFGYVPSPNIVLEENYISFGTVMDGLTETEELQVTNDGDVPLLISSVYIEGSASFTVENYSESIAENETGSISIKFSPDDESDFTGTLFIMCNDPDTDMVSVPLDGTGGEQAPVLSLSEDELYFGPVQSGTTVEKELIIYNEGVLDLEIEEITITGSDFYTTDFSDATIEPGNSIVALFNFAPTEEVNEVIATATISSNIGAYTIELIAGYFGPVWHISTAGSDNTGDGSEDNPYATIQKGVDQSSEGDTVLVDSGTYFENIHIDKIITLTSYISLYPENTDIIKNTIIDGSNEGVVINIGSITYQNEYHTLEVKGFTISNGLGTEDCEIGEGISSFSYVSPLIVQNCVMISNDEDNCNISWEGDIVLNKVTMRKLAIVGYYPWHVIANNSIIYGSIVEPGGDYPNIYDISYSLLPLFWEGEGNIVADPLFCDTLNGDFSLAENSPSVGSGENGTDMGALSVGCDAIDLSLSDANQVPMAYTLYQNYPNPFNPTTQIRYDLPEDQFVNITIYDVMGRKIRSLMNVNQTAGYHSMQWDAMNDVGEGVSAGMYIYTLQAGEFRSTKKMVLLK